MTFGIILSIQFHKNILLNSYTIQFHKIMTSLNYNQMNLHRVLPLKLLHKFYIYLNNFSNTAYQNPQPSPMSIETTATSMTTIKNEQNKTRHKEKSQLSF